MADAVVTRKSTPLALALSQANALFPPGPTAVIASLPVYNPSTGTFTIPPPTIVPQVVVNGVPVPTDLINKYLALNPPVGTQVYTPPAVAAPPVATPTVQAPAAPVALVATAAIPNAPLLVALPAVFQGPGSGAGGGPGQGIVIGPPAPPPPPISLPTQAYLAALPVGARLEYAAYSGNTLLTTAQKQQLTPDQSNYLVQLEDAYQGMGISEAGVTAAQINAARANNTSVITAPPVPPPTPTAAPVAAPIPIASFPVNTPRNANAGGIGGGLPSDAVQIYGATDATAGAVQGGVSGSVSFTPESDSTALVLLVLAVLLVVNL